MNDLIQNILVVSDNHSLVKFFRDEIDKIKFDNIYIRYCYSANNKSPSNLIEMGMTPVDMKDSKVVYNLSHSCDLIISLHCKQIFPAELVKTVRCINIHPGYNPYNRGWYPQVFSIINKLPIGATIHIMDHEIDHGEIIDQEQVEVFVTDTSEDVYMRVVETEKRLITKNLRNLISGNYHPNRTTTDGNYNSISDFRQICSLDLNSVDTLGAHLDLLRALSHGNFLNAFITDDDGEKVYVRLSFVRNNISKS